MPSAEQFFVVDVRPGWIKPAHHPFVTLWGADNCGYVYSLDRAGRYTRETLEHGYHYKHAYGSLRALERYPVPCAFAESLAVPVPDHLRDRWRDVRGPVIINEGRLRMALRRNRLWLGDPSAFDKRKAEAA